MGGISIFLSGHPAITGLVHDKGAKHFKNYELPARCTLGTVFGVGFIV